MKKLKCPKCGKENPEGSKFCQDCRKEFKTSKRKWTIGIIFLIIIVGLALLMLTFKGTYEKFDDSLVQSVEAGIPQDKILNDVEVNKKLMTQEIEQKYQFEKETAESTNKTADTVKYNHEIAVINEYYLLRVSYVKGEINKETFLKEAKKIRQELINNNVE